MPFCVQTIRSTINLALEKLFFGPGAEYLTVAQPHLFALYRYSSKAYLELLLSCTVSEPFFFFLLPSSNGAECTCSCKGSLEFLLDNVIVNIHGGA